jgi:hypothetical protein
MKSVIKTWRMRELGMWGNDSYFSSVGHTQTTKFRDKVRIARNNVLYNINNNKN